MAASTSALWEVFSLKATLLGSEVARVPTQEAAAEAVLGATDTAAFTSQLAERSSVLASRLAGPARREGQLSAPDVVGAAELAVAETGSLLLCTSNTDRGVMFLASRLWLLVRADDIVPTLDDALSRVDLLIGDGARYLTLMNGPSRTADIERTLTIGVHGPAALTILVVGDAP